MANVLRQGGIRFVFATAYDRWELPGAHVHMPHCDEPVRMSRLMELLAGP